MRKKYIPSVTSQNTIKVFEAETGQLYKMVQCGNGKIAGQPIITDKEMYVEMIEAGDKKVIKYFSLPNFMLTKSVPVC